MNDEWFLVDKSGYPDSIKNVMTNEEFPIPLEVQGKVAYTTLTSDASTYAGDYSLDYTDALGKARYKNACRIIDTKNNITTDYIGPYAANCFDDSYNTQCGTDLRKINDRGDTCGMDSPGVAAVAEDCNHKYAYIRVGGVVRHTVPVFTYNANSWTNSITVNRYAVGAYYEVTCTLDPNTGTLCPTSYGNVMGFGRTPDNNYEKIQFPGSYYTEPMDADSNGLVVLNYRRDGEPRQTATFDSISKEYKELNLPASMDCVNSDVHAYRISNDGSHILMNCVKWIGGSQYSKQVLATRDGDPTPPPPPRKKANMAPIYHLLLD
jgi:hypothetical protein